MKNDFWKKLQKTGKPILALAPMAGFSDSPFRQICKAEGADVLFSEMASATALFYNRQLRHNATLELLEHDPRREKRYVVQLFGSEPEHFALAAKVVTEQVKPDGLDINFGCPVPKVMKQGAGSALMADLPRARAVIEAVLANTDLPVSIKIRTRSGAVGALEFLDNISDLPVSALTIHGRTLKQGFVGAPDWKLVREARKHFSGVILANGGINDLAAAKKALRESRADGLALARGALGRPWLFKEIRSGKAIDLSEEEVFAIALRQARLENEAGGPERIAAFRKHLVWYLQGLPGASKLRSEAVKASSVADIEKLFAPGRDLCLHIDTAGREDIVISLTSAGRRLAGKKLTAPRRQAEKLLPAIAALLKASGFQASRIKKIAVNNRGGSFTSLRIGVITANALAYALDIPVVPEDGDASASHEFNGRSLVVPVYDREPNIGRRQEPKKPVR